MLRFKIRTTSLHLLLYDEGELDCSHGLNSILLVAFMWQIALAGEPKMASFTRWQPWWQSSKCQSRVALGSSSVASLLCDLWVVILTEQDQALRRNSPRDSHRNSTTPYQTSKSQIVTSRTPLAKQKSEQSQLEERWICVRLIQKAPSQHCLSYCLTSQYRSEKEKSDS